MSLSSVEYRNVSKSFGDVEVIKELNMAIEEKEFVVLVGPSGCGKSTLLRMLAGLENVTDGDIYIGDRKVNDVAPKDRDIAMVFQSYALYPHMSVFDNMAFGLKLRKVPKREIQNRVARAAEILGLEDYLKRKPRALSGGQRQRVAVGRAIVREPRVFLLDEPLSNLDAQLRVQARVEISALQRQLGTTMVYVTHDQVEAMTMGHRIAILNQGVLHQFDTPTNVYENPADAFVAQFIGSPSMNMLEAKVVQSDGELSIVVDDANRLPLPAARRDSLKEYVGKAIKLGIRPEHAYLEGQEPVWVKHKAKLTGKLSSTELLGRETNIFIEVGGVDSFIFSADGVYTGEIGSTMPVVVDMFQVYTFDSASGKAITS